jgi:hypothetical protein
VTDASQDPYQGDLIEFRWEFRQNDVPGRPLVNPDNVFFAFQVGDNPSSAPITFAGATTPGTGIIWTTGKGRFRTWVDSTVYSGLYVPKAWSTGMGQAQVPPISVNVLPKPF